MADHLISRNYQGTVRGRLLPKADNDEGEVHIVQWRGPNSQSEGIARYVSYLLNQGKASLGEILILSPRKVFGKGILAALANAGIPAHGFYAINALEELDAQESMCLLTLLCDPDDRVALRWWLGRRGAASWEANQYGRIRNYCESTGTSPRECLEQLISGTTVLSRVTRIVDRYKELVARLEQLRELATEEVVDTLFPSNQEWARLLRATATTSIGENTEISSVLGILQASLIQPEVPEGQIVRVMSFHGAKGLTSKIVIVAGCNDGIIPRVDFEAPEAEQRASLEEQRRIFYVAITRAKETLVLSSVANIEPAIAHAIGAQVSRSGSAYATPFIDDLGNERPYTLSGDTWLTGLTNDLVQV